MLVVLLRVVFLHNKILTICYANKYHYEHYQTLQNKYGDYE